MVAPVSSFWSALVVVFVAELGDKSQLVALGLGARSRPGWVLIGMGLAYVVANTLSVTVGATVGAAIPEDVMLVGGGLLFLGFAAWTLLDADDEDTGQADPASESDVVSQTRAQVVTSVAVTMFVAELGDKTMLATATLASTQDDAVLVWSGATVGIFSVGALAAGAGRAIGSRLSAQLVRIGAAALFAVFAVVLIVSALG